MSEIESERTMEQSVVVFKKKSEHNDMGKKRWKVQRRC